MDEFWQFVAERQAIWYRRFVEKKPKPWTDDPVIRNTKFCNIYRELDPGTKFIVEEVLERGLTLETALFNVMLYRLIGRAETLREVGVLDPAAYAAVRLIRDLKRVEEKHPVFTGAYIVAAYGEGSKIENIARMFETIAKNLPSMAAQLTARSLTSEQAYKVILEQPGFGNFLAYQVLVDLRYPLKVWGGKPTLPQLSNNDWVSAGPGAMRGLAMLGVLDKRLHLQAMRWLRDNQESEFKRLHLTFHAWEGRSLDLANIQGCLCEYHKYHKIKNNTGKGRATYPGEGTMQVSMEAFW